jgi:hypothetical protein
MTLVLVAMLGLLAETQGGTGEIVVGVLEQPQCKKDPAIAVKALFVKQGREWVALTSQEASLGVSLPAAWTVGLDGRSLGVITTVDPGFQTEYEWTFPRDRLLLLKPGQSVPNIANKEDRFAGWCDAPSRRPLVVVSRPAVRDPDRWKPYQPAETLRARLFESFKTHAGPASICPNDSETAKPLTYAVQDLVFLRSYQDRFGKKLVTVGLDPQRNTCDGPAEPAWAPHSFVLGDKLLYLGQDLSVVEAGDFDSDGTSEVLFWYSGYNDDGYTLFYDGFRKHVDYRWNYH